MIVGPKYVMIPYTGRCPYELGEWAVIERGNGSVFEGRVTEIGTYIVTITRYTRPTTRVYSTVPRKLVI